MPETENNHWTDKLEHFHSVPSVLYKIFAIEEKRRTIAWLEAEIENLEEEIEERVRCEYSQEEINIARAKFTEEQDA